MNKLLYIVTFFLITVSIAADTTTVHSNRAGILRKHKEESEIRGDSIMRLVIQSAQRYEKTLSSYEAEVYIKGRAQILKKNQLIRFAHHLFPVDRKKNDFVFELFSHSQFEAPNNYLHDFQAVNGSAIPNRRKQEEFLTFLNLNVYAPTAYNEDFLMPVAKGSFRFYKFDLIDIEEVDGLTIYRIRFLPKQLSQKLISGDLYIVDKTWAVDKIDLSGRYSFADFNLVMTFGRDFRRFILPETANVSVRYRILGNSVTSTYHANFKYSSVEWIEEDNENEKKSLDLSSYYRLSSDTVPIITDSTYWNKRRDIPLTETEENLYATSKFQEQIVEKDSLEDFTFLEVTQKLTNSLRFDNKSMRIRYSGILNPFQLGYSKRYGITYKQKIRFTKNFSDDRQLRITPEVGFVFKRKEVFFNVRTDWEYLPERMGRITLKAGNDYNSYSSEIMEEINQILKDSTFNFDDLNLKYFRHYFVDLRHHIEVINGLQVSAGVAYHRRLAIKEKNNIDDDVNEDINNIIGDKYNDFTPVIGVSYTPRQYYRMDGKMKEYVYSRYPTFSLEFARGIPKVMNSTGNYNRIEADIHQSVNVGMSRRFNYHLSAGMFTMQKSAYFADFEFFRRRYFPQTWSDQIGGVFNQLSSDWYNASDKYVQGHFMFQSPFMFSRIFNMRKAYKHILSERIYLSQLWTPVLPSYTEIGYGIGNHIFNIGVFAGFEKEEFQSIGVKFAFELFQ